MTAIDLVGLSKSFGSVAAVKDLTLNVADKEFVALLGPSGCGKTTTMNMIAGIETPTAGQILFDGVDVSKLPPPKRNIGFVFQNYAIFTHMTVYENLAFGLRVKKKDKLPKADLDKARADAKAKKPAIYDKVKSVVAEYTKTLEASEDKELVAALLAAAAKDKDKARPSKKDTPGKDGNGILKRFRTA